MAQEQHQYEVDNQVEINPRGVFDFSEKKEDEKPNQDQFIKSDDKKESQTKIQRSNSNPSSGSFNDVDGEKKNKGLTEKIKEKITGEERKERELEHQAAAHSEKKQEEEKSMMEKIKEKIPDTAQKKNTTTDEADFHKGEAEDKKGFMERITGGEKKEENGGDVTSPQEKKNFMEKVKEMFPGADKKSTDGESAPTEHRPAEMDFHKDEASEKKGFTNKIKEKLPGEHKNNEVGEKLE